MVDCDTIGGVARSEISVPSLGSDKEGERCSVVPFFAYRSSLYKRNKQSLPRKNSMKR